MLRAMTLPDGGQSGERSLGMMMARLSMARDISMLHEPNLIPRSSANLARIWICPTPILISLAHSTLPFPREEAWTQLCDRCQELSILPPALSAERLMCYAKASALRKRAPTPTATDIQSSYNITALIVDYMSSFRNVLVVKRGEHISRDFCRFKQRSRLVLLLYLMYESEVYDHIINSCRIEVMQHTHVRLLRAWYALTACRCLLRATITVTMVVLVVVVNIVESHHWLMLTSACPKGLDSQFIEGDKCFDVNTCVDDDDVKSDDYGWYCGSTYSEAAECSSEL